VKSHEGIFESVILLDTATGDLYKADSDDIKKYADRPKDRPLGPPFRGRDDGRRPEPGRDGRERRPREEKDRARPRDPDIGRPAVKDRDRDREDGNDR
jgi:hypothetical protein